MQGTLSAFPPSRSAWLTGPAMTDQGAGEPIWKTPMIHGAKLVRKLLKAGWPDGVVLNLNFPDCEPEEVEGMTATVQGLRDANCSASTTAWIPAARPLWNGVERRKATTPRNRRAVRGELIRCHPLVATRISRRGKAHKVDGRRPGRGGCRESSSASIPTRTSCIHGAVS